MDQIKIGKYIAEKRKSLNMTQVQLAEKLGMSDKSVSKWERGICLPDISVYMQLCDILGISLNEFIAGEDLDEKNIVEKSEENLIQVAFDGKNNGKKLKKVIAVLLIIIILVTGTLAYVIYTKGFFMQNYITPIPKESVTMKTARLLSGVDGAFIYEYSVDDSFEEMIIGLSIYEKGRLTSQEDVVRISMEGKSGREGIIAIVPDFDNFKVKMIAADESTKYNTDLDILEGVKDREYYGRSASEIEEGMTIQGDKAQGLLALIYDKDLMSVFPIKTIAEGNADELVEDDFIYCFSIKFRKK